MPGASLRPGSLAFNPRPRRLSTPPDAFQLHPDIRLYRTALTQRADADDADDAAGPRPAAEAAGAARADGEARGRSLGAPRGVAVARRHQGRRVSRRRGRRGSQGVASVGETPSDVDDDDRASGAFYTLVPIRPRRRGERRSLRTFAVASLRPPLAFNTRPRRLSTPTDAFQLHPDIALYGSRISFYPRRRTSGRRRRRRRRRRPARRRRAARRGARRAAARGARTRRRRRRRREGKRRSRAPRRTGKRRETTTAAARRTRRFTTPTRTTIRRASTRGTGSRSSSPGIPPGTIISSAKPRFARLKFARGTRGVARSSTRTTARA